MRSLTFSRANVPDLRTLPLTTIEDMQAVGQLLRQRILDRTARGVDAEGRPFAPYSSDYADLKREQLGAAGVVDLTMSGQMLQSIEILPAAKSVRLVIR